MSPLGKTFFDNGQPFDQDTNPELHWQQMSVSVRLSQAVRDCQPVSLEMEEALPFPAAWFPLADFWQKVWTNVFLGIKFFFRQWRTIVYSNSLLLLLAFRFIAIACSMVSVSI